MKRETLYQPFEIVYKKIDECPKNEHKHLFFELVFILSGTGKQCINNNSFDYHPNHMFLITPEDCHSFNIDTTTEFFFLRFTDHYLKANALHIDDQHRLEFILQNASHQPGCILKNFADKPLVRSLAEAIMSEYGNENLYNKELVKKLVDALIVIVARNIAKYMPASVKEDSEEKVVSMLNYIQANIYQPEKLKIDNLSRHFDISESYLSKYFKTHTRETVQQYIANLRIKLIEARLRFSNMRINEISNELGFADESHFNKFFRKSTGKSASQYRKELTLHAAS